MIYASQMVGWMMTMDPVSPGSGQFYSLDLLVLQGVLAPKFMGDGATPLELLEHMQVVLLPMGLPLPPGHGLPVGQVNTASIGSRDF